MSAQRTDINKIKKCLYYFVLDLQHPDSTSQSSAQPINFAESLKWVWLFFFFFPENFQFMLAVKIGHQTSGMASNLNNTEDTECVG